MQTGTENPAQPPFCIEDVVRGMNERTKGEKGILKSWHSKDINPGVGFLSDILRITFEWEKPCALPNQVVFKIPGMTHAMENFGRLDMSDELAKNPEMAAGMAPTPENLAQQMEMFATLHKKECNFYEMFSSDPPLVLPAVYFTSDWSPKENKQGIVVMNDLSETTKMVELVDGLNLEQVYAVVDQLASLHARVWKLKNDDWKTTFKQETEQLANFVPMMKLVACQLLKMRPGMFESLWERALPLYGIEYMTNALTEHEKHGIPTTMVNGDLWLTNLLWERTDKGTPSNKLIAIIDWQMTQPGSPLADLMRLLMSSVTAKFRRENSTKIVTHYYQKMKEHLGDEINYSLDDLLAHWEAIVPWGAAIVSFGIPLWIGIPAITDGPDKQARVDELLDRAKCSLEDGIKVLDKQ